MNLAVTGLPPSGDRRWQEREHGGDAIWRHVRRPCEHLVEIDAIAQSVVWEPRRWPWNQHTGNHPHGNVGHIVIGAPSIRPTRRIWGWIAVGIMGEHGEALLVGGSRGWDAEVQTQQLRARIGAGTSARILPGIFEE